MINLSNQFCKDGYIIINIKIKYRLDFTPNYVFVLDGKCYNQRTGRFVRQVSNNGSIGYILNGVFWSCKKLKPHLVK